MRLINNSASRFTFALVFVSLGAVSIHAQSARALYERAQAKEKSLPQARSRPEDKKLWVAAAKAYHRVVLEHPRSGYCDDALYYEGQIYKEIDRRFKDSVAVKRAQDAFYLLATGYPSSQWASKARLARAHIFRDRMSDEPRAIKEFKLVRDRFPHSAEASDAKTALASLQQPARLAPKHTPTARLSASPIMVRNIRHWSGREYTRIVIDMDGQVEFSRGRLAKPDRIYFDMFNTRLSKNLAARIFPIGDGFLQQIRVGQYQADVVRIVLDFDSISNYNVFFLPDPYRMVVDILGTRPDANAPRVAESTPPSSTGDTPPPTSEESAPTADFTSKPTDRPSDEATLAAAASPDPSIPGETDRSTTSGELARAATPAPSVASTERNAPDEAHDDRAPAIDTTEDTDLRLPAQPARDGYSIARQFGLAAKRIVIDPGHGGKDPGTARKSLKEKSLALDISRRVAELLREGDEFDVIMTREKDVFIPLEERTAIANTQEADVFVSIHINAARSRRARGIETFYLNLATTPEAEAVAARENATTTRRLAELEDLLDRVMNNNRIQESRELAHFVQDALSSTMFDSKKDRRNRGVKTAPLYVLLGARMPAVLVEAGFVSNSDDASYLAKPAERQRIAESIASGIRNYHRSLSRSTTADVETPRTAGARN